jgi:hypothetical protein
MTRLASLSATPSILFARQLLEFMTSYSRRFLKGETSQKHSRQAHHQRSPLLRAAYDESFPELQKLWPELITAAMDPNWSDRVRLSFIDEGAGRAGRTGAHETGCEACEHLARSDRRRTGADRVPEQPPDRGRRSRRVRRRTVAYYCSAANSSRSPLNIFETQISCVLLSMT